MRKALQLSVRTTGKLFFLWWSLLPLFFVASASGIVCVRSRSNATCGGPHGTWAREGWPSQPRILWKHGVQMLKPSASPLHQKTCELAVSGGENGIQRRLQNPQCMYEGTQGGQGWNAKLFPNDWTVCPLNRTPWPCGGALWWWGMCSSPPQVESPQLAWPCSIQIVWTPPRISYTKEQRADSFPHQLPHHISPAWNTQWCVFLSTPSS